MQLRPCIDIHNGKVKQIIGGSLTDKNNQAVDNFVANLDADYYANIYKEKGLTGGHVIILNKKDSEYYEESLRQARLALSTFPGGLMIGGGINAENAADFIEAGASHVIVTSYVFEDGKILYERIAQLRDIVGKDRLCLDLSCRKRDGKYYVVTDRWQKFSDEEVSSELFNKLSGYCDEFLVHGVDVEGKKAGLDTELIEILANVDASITYAGGVGNISDILLLKDKGLGKINVTVGSALDLFGGTLSIDEIMENI